MIQFSWLERGMEENLREIIQRELPGLIMKDPQIRDWVWHLIHEYAPSKAESESRFEQMLAELHTMRDEFQREMRQMREEFQQEMRSMREESERRWEEDRRKWEENLRQWKENERKWEEHRRKWEENERKWEEHQRKWEESLRWWEENQRKWEENERKWEENQRWWEENQRKWEENQRRWEENQRKWEENERKWEENQRWWEENQRKWEENQRWWEENQRKWEENQRRWEENQRKWEENERKWEENQRRWEENQAIIRDLLQKLEQVDHRIDRTIGALGARWGASAEASFRNALKGILEKSFGVTVERVEYWDDQGMVFGHPDLVELDVLIHNGEILVCEIKSSASRADIYAFERKIQSYEGRIQRKVDRKLLISPMVLDKDKALAQTLGIEVYSDAIDIVPPEPNSNLEP
jgi:hypothetical protein